MQIYFLQDLEINGDIINKGESLYFVKETKDIYTFEKPVYGLDTKANELYDNLFHFNISKKLYSDLIGNHVIIPIQDDIKTRGFEKISKKQFKEDFKELDINYEDIKLPKRSTAKSAGYDCYTPVDIVLEPNQEIKLPTGIRSYMLPDEVLFALPRSGHGFKYYLRLANTQGVIDADYYESDNEGHIFVKLRNEGTKTLEIKKGTGMCQLIFQKYLLSDGDDFAGEQRNGGFGSTDKNK